MTFSAGSRFLHPISSERLFWPAVVVLLTYLCAVQIGSAMRESITVDEPEELGAGYSYWMTGDFRMNPEHPPLAKMVAALPLLWFDLIPLRDPADHGNDIIPESVFPWIMTAQVMVRLELALVDKKALHPPR